MMLLLRRIWVQVTTDRRRFGILCAMAVLGLLLWSRLIIVSNMPRTVIADAPAPDEAPAETATSDNQRGGPIAVVLARSPRRDPFAINPDYFPRPTKLPTLQPEAGKSMPVPAEIPEEQEAQLLRKLQDVVSGLRLEAVMVTGSVPVAVIEKRTYRMDDMIVVQDSPSEFRVMEIRQRSVMLDWHGRTFELSMDKKDQSKK
jgi:hypothetical protein